VCTSRFLTTLGILEPSAVLQRIALAQIEAATPDAADGAEYLRAHASPELKQTIWQRLEHWQESFVSSGAEQRWNSGHATADDIPKHELVMVLTSAFEAAHGWVLSPEDERRLKTLLGDENTRVLQCRFACGASLSVGPGPGRFTIVRRTHPTDSERENRDESMEYLNSPERLRYSVNQYACANLKELEDKLLQFPRGSTFFFDSYFSERDRDELIEIANFLMEHSYKVGNISNWPFLVTGPQLPSSS
jgi:hypothetical protein